MLPYTVVTYITSLHYITLLTFVIVHREIVVISGYATCYEIGSIEYSNANVFFWFMISNLFYAFGKKEELQSRVKGQIPKK